MSQPLPTYLGLAADQKDSKPFAHAHLIGRPATAPVRRVRARLCDTSDFLVELVSKDLLIAPIGWLKARH